MLLLLRNESFSVFDTLPQALPTVNVDSMGNATTSFPIQLPPGTGDIVPDLSLVYNSASGNGILGVGWSLHGIETIYRDYPISFTESDAYICSLFGKFKSKSDYTLSTTYVSEQESYFKIEKKDDDWIIYDRSGTKYEFSEKIKKSEESDAPTVFWALSKVTGVNSNYTYTITYGEGSQKEGYPYPKTIEYNGGKTIIRFDYETSRTDTTTQFTRANYEKMSKLLKTIVVENNGEEIEKYTLSYKTGSSERNRLHRIERDKYKPINFSYSNRDVQDDTIVLYSQFEQEINYSYYPEEETEKSQLCSLGEAFCVCVNKPEKCGLYTTFTQQACAYYWVKLRSLCVEGIDKSLYFFEDIDGNSVVEFVKVVGSTKQNRIVAIDTLTGTKTHQSANFTLLAEGTVMPGDIDGDGKTDFFILEGEGKPLKITLGKDNYNKIITPYYVTAENPRQVIILHNLKKEENDKKTYHFAVSITNNFRTSFIQKAKGDALKDVSFHIYHFDKDNPEEISLIDSIEKFAEEDYGTEWQMFYDVDKSGVVDFVRIKDGELLISYIGDFHGGNYSYKKRMRKILNPGQHQTTVDSVGTEGNRFLADVNGDGYLDFVVFDGQKLNIYLYNGNDFEPKIRNEIHHTFYSLNSDKQTPISNKYKLDMNGDDRLDLIEPSSQNLILKLYDPNSKEYKEIQVTKDNATSEKIDCSVAKDDENIYQADLNNDQINDEVKCYHDADKETMNLSTHLLDSGGNTIQSFSIKVDVKDIFPSPSEPGKDFNNMYNSWINTKMFAFVDGDNKADFIRFEGGKIYISLSKNLPDNQFYSPEGDKSFEATAFTYAIDIDGDKDTDFIGLHADYQKFYRNENFEDKYNMSSHKKKGVYYLYKTGNENTTDLLIKANVGEGNQIQEVNLEYGFSKEPFVNGMEIGVRNTFPLKHDEDLSPQVEFPIISRYIPDTVLKKVETKLGGGYSQITEYEYYSRRFYAGGGNIQDLGFAGIDKKITSKSPSETLVSKERTYYNQYENIYSSTFNTTIKTTKLAGTIKKIYKFYPNNEEDVITKTFYQYRDPYIENYRTLIQQSKIIKESYDGISPKITETFEYDEYGNAKTKTIKIGEESNPRETRQTTNVYNYDTTNWILNRPSSITETVNGIKVKAKTYTYSGNNVDTTSEYVGINPKTNHEEWKTTTYSNYDDWGNPQTITDSRSNSKTLKYDSIYHKYVVSTKGPNENNSGIIKTYDYNTGKVISTSDNYGKTINRYDDYNRLIEVKYPYEKDEVNGWNERYTYFIGDAGNLAIKKEIKDGPWSIEYINPLGKVYKKESKLYSKDGEDVSSIEITNYDLFGRIKSQAKTDSKGITFLTTSYSYDDPLGRLTKITRPNGTETTITYDGLKKTSVTTGTSSSGAKQTINTTEITKNFKGQVIQKIENGVTLTYQEGYDPQCRYLITKNGETKITEERYDFSGKKLSHWDKNTGKTSYTYDTEGNMLTREDANGKIVIYKYDNQNRLESIDRPDFENDEFFVYDKNGKSGRLDTATIIEYDKETGEKREAIVYSYKYDEFGRLKYLKTIIDDLELIFQYDYDSMGRMNKMIYPNGIVLHKHYSESGHLNNITMDKGNNINNLVVQYALLPESNTLQRLTGNNVLTSVTYNPATQRPKSLVTKLESVHEIERISYAYDAAGNITDINDLIHSKNSQSFTYHDDFRRLKSATGVYDEDGMLKTKNYEYYVSGNLKTKDNISLTYYDDTHPNAVKNAKVETIAGPYDISYAYDKVGNMTERNDERFFYDSDNRMTMYQKNLDDQTKYLYDHRGIRVKKKRVKTGHIVYNIEGLYEVNRIPSKSDRHTMYIKGPKGDLVAQLTSENVVLVTDATIASLNNPDIFTSFSNFYKKNKIAFVKFLIKTNSDNPYSFKLFALYSVFFLLFLYILIYYVLDFYKKVQFVNPFFQEHRILSTVTPLVLVSVLLSFGNCVPDALVGHKEEPFWMLGSFLSNSGYEETPSISNPDQGGSPSPYNGVPVNGMYFFHPDHLGSIKMITDTHGRIAALGDTGASSVNYKPFGEINRTNSFGPDVFRYKYTGQQEDSESGLYFYKARYYDPKIGHFTQADSLINASHRMGFDQYMYTEGNPVNYSDPGGHKISKNQWANLYKLYVEAVIQDFASQSLTNATVASILLSRAIRHQEKKIQRQTNTRLVVAVAAIALGAALAYYGMAFALPEVSKGLSLFTYNSTTMTFAKWSATEILVYNMTAKVLFYHGVGTFAGYALGGSDLRSRAAGAYMGGLVGAGVGFMMGGGLNALFRGAYRPFLTKTNLAGHEEFMKMVINGETRSFGSWNKFIEPRIGYPQSILTILSAHSSILKFDENSGVETGIYLSAWIFGIPTIPYTRGLQEIEHYNRYFESQHNLGGRFLLTTHLKPYIEQSQ